jgi:hypothetical protein
MPEFEEENPNASQSESYTPSTDASQKPRTRRRSGGFKTEVAPISNAKIGEVSAAAALKKEKLSGSPTPEKSQTVRSEKPRRERSDAKPREPKNGGESRKKREAQAPRTDANPQPSTETLEAIASVEAKIAERRAEKDAHRAERNKTRSKKSRGDSQGSSSQRRSERGSSSTRRNNGSQKSSAKQAQGGLLGAIGGFFDKLFGHPEATQQRSSGHSRSGESRAQSKSGSKRGSQNRGRSGPGGRGGKGGSKGNRRSGSGSRRTKENVPS